jgi:hypothetical protein
VADMQAHLAGRFAAELIDLTEGCLFQEPVFETSAVLSWELPWTTSRQSESAAKSHQLRN